MTGTRDRLADRALTWVGVPYRDKGRDRAGVDCIGLLIKVAHEEGLTDFDTRDYPRRPVPQDFLRGIKGQLQRIPKSEAGRGDVLVFREPRHPCHVGILDVDQRGKVYVVHAYAPARRVIREPMTEERWDRALMAFRWPGDD